MNLADRTLILLIALALAGCANSKDLSRSRAADLISRNGDFGTVLDVKVPVGNIWCDWRFINDEVKQLRTAGILTLQESGQYDGIWNKEYVLELTERGKEMSKSWAATNAKMPECSSFRLRGNYCWSKDNRRGGEKCHEPNGVVYSVVLARKKIGNVTGITMDGGAKQGQAEFTWQWDPTAAAKDFPGQVPLGVHQGVAALQLYDDGWRLEELQLR